jgi:luciferase family oxidoreductase group 1
VWLLGSSTFGAQLAGALGLPFSFVYHFAPVLVDQALDVYRSNFQPSVILERPHVMIAVSVLCAPTNDEARWLSGSNALAIIQRSSGRMGPLPSPEEAAAYRLNPTESALVDETFVSHLIGDPLIVQAGLDALLERTDTDELLLSTRTHSYEARARSFSLGAKTWGLNGIGLAS